MQVALWSALNGSRIVSTRLAISVAFGNASKAIYMVSGRSGGGKATNLPFMATQRMRQLPEGMCCKTPIEERSEPWFRRPDALIGGGRRLDQEPDHFGHLFRSFERVSAMPSGGHGKEHTLCRQMI